MGAVGLLVRVELRRRWRSYVVLAILLGVVGGVVLTLLAGARRTESALERLRAETIEGDVSIEVSPEYFAAIEALPQVEAAAPGSFLFVMPADAEFDDLGAFAAPDGRFGAAVSRPRVIEGRLPLPGRTHEVGINRIVADRLRVGVGDRIPLVSLTPAQLEQLIDGGDPGEPAGPAIEVVVVGIGAIADEFASELPVMLFTPAFYAKYQDRVGHFDDILDVRLVHGAADMRAFRAGVERVVPRSEGAIIETDAETNAEVEDTTRVLALALVVFAVVACVAGFVAVGQALARRLVLSVADQQVLWAVGLGRRARSAVLLIPAGMVAFGGAALAVVVAVVASPLMPVGLAGRVEPDPGVDVDGLVLGLGFLAIFLALMARAGVSAWAAAGRLHVTTSQRRTPGLLGRLTRAGAPPPVVAGVRMALEAGGGRTAIPIRPAIAGAVAGVAGLVAALTFSAALGWVVTEPVAYGWTWDTAVVGPKGRHKLVSDAAALAEDRDAAAVAALGVLPVRFEGEPIQSYELETVKGSGFLVVLEGRAPRGKAEALVGSGTLERLGRAVGDTVTAEGLEGSEPRRVTIVGRGVFPEFIHPAVPDSDTGAYDEFALFTRAGAAAVTPEPSREYFSVMLVRWRDGTNQETAVARLAGQGDKPITPTLPPNLQNLARVDVVPLLVGAFLVLLAAAAIAHVIVTSVHARARDFAVLRVLGFVGWQVRATVASQATTLAAVGLMIGIPLGLIAGRTAWGFVAHGLGVDPHVPMPWVAIAAAVPAAVVLVNLIAAFPARRAARHHAAVILRSE